MKKNTAFSLIEVLMAIALGGLVLTSVATLMVSLTNIWLNKDQHKNFFEKISGIESFLETHLSYAVFLPDDEPQAIFIERDPDIANREPILQFFLRKSAPLLEYEGIPSRQIQCALHLDSREGLVLYWKSPWSKKDRYQKYQKIILAKEAISWKFYNYNEALEKWESVEIDRIDHQQTSSPSNEENDEYFEEEEMNDAEPKKVPIKKRSSIPELLKIKFKREDTTKSIVVRLNRELKQSIQTESASDKAQQSQEERGNPSHFPNEPGPRTPNERDFDE